MSEIRHPIAINATTMATDFESSAVFTIDDSALAATTDKLFANAEPHEHEGKTTVPSQDQRASEIMKDLESGPSLRESLVMKPIATDRDVRSDATHTQSIGAQYSTIELETKTAETRPLKRR
jgi:hypothetical protein